MSEKFQTDKKSNPIKEKIIVALDVPTADEARAIISELRAEVGAFKIGLQLFTAAGASFVRELTANNVKIFLDVKFHDIPNTVSSAALEVAKLGVWMFNVHAAGGGEMMRRTIESVKEFCAAENLNVPKIIAVTVLTSADRETLGETGIETDVGEQVLRLARLAAAAKLDGVVASPREIELIRSNIDDKNFLIVTPGIRNAADDWQNQNAKIAGKSDSISATYDDQKRVMTAGEAVRAGSDFLVVGRPILKAKDKVLAVREIIKQIEFS